MTIYRAHELMHEMTAAIHNASGTAAFDLSKVTELDTAGLQILLMARRIADKQGIRLAVIHPSECVSDVLSLCSLTSLVPDQAELQVSS